MATRTLALIDGSALAYRSYFVFIRNPLTNSKGENTSAVYGFANTLLKILREDEPDHIAIAFDTRAPTFRHELYPEYKSTRAKMPDELRQSIPQILELIDAFGVPLVRRDGMEADDVIGSLAVTGAKAGLDVSIYSGDKDFCQLVSDRVQIVRPRGGGDEERLDAEGVTEWMGVPPGQIIDLLALMGDTSDNVPGVPGIGQKTAVKLLAEHGSLDAVLENASSIKGKLGEKLVAHRDEAELSRRLVTIDTGLDLGVTLDDLHAAEPDRDRLVAMFERYEFKRFIDLFAAPRAAEVAATYAVVRDEATLDALAAALEASACIGVDVEATPGAVFDGRLIGLALATEPGRAWYLPLAHATLLDGAEATLDPAACLERVKPILADRDRPKVVHDAKAAAAVLARHDVTLDGVTSDTLLAAYLLDPGRNRYALADVARAELDQGPPDRSDVLGTGRAARAVDEVSADELGPLACAHADFARRVADHQAPKLDGFELRRLHDEVELPLAGVLSDMERHGVLLDPAVFESMSTELQADIARLEDEIHALAGREFNVNSPPQLRVVLFEELGLPAGRKTKTGASTDSDVLEKLTSKHPIAQKILDYRQSSKLLSTYVEALPKLVRPDTGRLHTSFHQTGAATGRLSSSDPNLQNIPIRTEAGRRIRDGFVAPDGWVLLSADYSQVELRVLASICADPGLVEAFASGVDVHRHTAAAVFGVPLESVTSEMRARSKAVNFGVIYGQGPRGLAEALRIPLKEAKSFIESYFARYAAVKTFKDETLEQARRDGYVKTLLGRRRYLTDINAGHHQRRAYAERMAVNTVIQGTAADLMKIALVRIARRLAHGDLRAKMLLTVHDELVFECPSGETDALAALAREEMTGALDLAVPLVVDVGTGRTWLEAH